jgi:hypothetical protein
MDHPYGNGDDPHIIKVNCFFFCKIKAVSVFYEMEWSYNGQMMSMYLLSEQIHTKIVIRFTTLLVSQTV